MGPTGRVQQPGGESGGRMRPGPTLDEHLASTAGGRRGAITRTRPKKIKAIEIWGIAAGILRVDSAASETAAKLSLTQNVASAIEFYSKTLAENFA